MEKLSRVTHEIRDKGKLQLLYYPDIIPINICYAVYQECNRIFEHAPIVASIIGCFASAKLPSNYNSLKFKPWNFPYLMDYLDIISEQFEKVEEFRYYEQRQACGNFQWPFNTIRINRNKVSKVHNDSIMLDNTLSFLGCVRSPFIESFNTIFPDLNISIDVQNGDLLIADLRFRHGNDYCKLCKNYNGSEAHRYSIVAFCT